MNRLFRHFSLLMALFLAVQVVSAQNFEIIETNKDEHGKFVRGSYLTNQWYDNWAFSLSGGLQTMITGTDYGTARLNPSVEFGVTKWVTPTIAVRAGYQGFSLEENFDPYNYDHYLVKTNADRTIAYYSQMYLHGDVLLSVTNLVGGYSMKRFMNVAPFAHFGYLRLSHPDYSYFDNVMRDREVAMGLGLNVSFRITHNISAIVDYRNSFISGRFHDASSPELVRNHSITAGLSYTIKKWYWTRSQTIERTRDNAIAAQVQAEQVLHKVEEEKNMLEAKVGVVEKHAAEVEARATNAERAIEVIAASDPELAQRLREFRIEHQQMEQLATENPNDELIVRAAKSDFIVYFDINSDKLSGTEQLRLDAFIRQISVVDPDHIFYITGSADEGTGNLTINTRLSKSRAQNIKNILLKYGVPEGQIVIKATIVTHEHADGRLDRCVLFENK